MIILSELAFAKLRWFRLNCNENNVCGLALQKPSFLEVSLMGISASEEDIGFITDFVCIPQEASMGLTEPTDEGFAKHWEDMLIDKDISIIRCARFWAHTHPGTSPEPSSTDNDTFKKWYNDSDFGVMYILADGDDSCTVKHKSNHFGVQKERMQVYVMLEQKDAHGEQVIMNTSTIFAMDKMIEKAEGYPYASDLLLSDYSAFYPEWMEELKANVKKKQHGTHTHSHYGTTTSGRTAGFHQNAAGNNASGNGSSNNSNSNNSQTTQSSATGQTTTTSTSTESGRVTAGNVLHILIKNKRENINQFSREVQQKIADVFGVTIGDLQTAYNNLKTYEKNFDVNDIMIFEKDLIDDAGMSKKDTITPEAELFVCKNLLVRPVALWEYVDKYIAQAVGIKPVGP